MDSLASVFATPTESPRPMAPVRTRPRPSGASVALAFSLLCHVALGLLAAPHLRPVSLTPELHSVPIELLAADFEVLEQADHAPPSPAPTDGPVAAMRAIVKTSLVHRAAPAAPATPAWPDAAEAKADPAPVEVKTSPENGAPHFKLSVAPTSGNTNAKVAASTLGSSGSGFSNQPISSASADIPAKLRAGNLPAYTPSALAAGIEASVALEIVVSETGLVTSVRGLEHVGYGLDEAARQRALGYRFTPASRNGKPVPARTHCLMRFQLR